MCCHVSHMVATNYANMGSHGGIRICRKAARNLRDIPSVETRVQDHWDLTLEPRGACGCHPRHFKALSRLPAFVFTYVSLSSLRQLFRSKPPPPRVAIVVWAYRVLSTFCRLPVG